MENTQACRYYPDVTRQNIMDALIETLRYADTAMQDGYQLSCTYSSVSDGVALNISRKTLKASGKIKSDSFSLSLKAVSRGMSER